MSMSAIRTIANSALMASQARMQVTSANIANADTDGYTRKSADQEAAVTGGTNSGTTVTGISSSVDKYMLASLVGATSTQSAAQTLSDYTDSLQSAFGTVTSDDDTTTSLASDLTDLETALTSLSGTPESDTLANSALDSVTTLTAQLRETSQQVQTLRGNADQEIGDTVDTINQTLKTIDTLNDQIVSAKAQGVSTADLEDQRTQALQTLAENVSVSYQVNSAGRMQIATKSGTMLLDSQVHQLDYTPAAYVGSDTVFDPITVDGQDITGSVSGGSLGTLISLRDSELPQVQDELDNLAGGLISTVNAAYNQGTALPAPDSLTGMTSVDASDTLSASGTARIALVGDDGTLNSYADFDLSSYATVGDLADAINTTSGLSASVADGVLKISSTDGSGVAVADIGASIGSGGEGFSAYFGLNDLLTGTDASNIGVSDAVTSDGFATASLSTDTTLTAGDQVVAHSADFVDTLLSALTDDQSFGAAGDLSATKTSFAGYAANIVADVATRADTASSALTTAQNGYDTVSDAFSSETGVNVDEETANLTELQQLYAATTQIYTVLNEMFSNLLTAARSAS